MTVLSLSDFDLSPKIILASDEHRTLTRLAMSGIDSNPVESDSLLQELDRADIVADGAVPADVVRMNSVVFYRTTSGDHRSVQLVLPQDADIDAGKISVMTPVGIALIGMRTGQSITWVTRDNRKEILTVLGVVQPDEDNDPGPAAA